MRIWFNQIRDRFALNCWYLFFSTLFFSLCLNAQVDCKIPFSLNQTYIRDEKHMGVYCTMSSWKPEDLVVMRNNRGEISSLLQVESESLLKLLSIRSDRFLLPGDEFTKLDLTTDESDLKGTSYLWKAEKLPADTKIIYRPLFTQGATIGDTAQTLWKNEYYFTTFGTIGYGAHEYVTVTSNLTALALGSPNGKIKGRFYKNENQTWSMSVSMAQENNSSEKLFNVDLMWDSILSENIVAHSLISAAVISFDSAKEVAALKSYGSSSIQTGYEYIFSDWSRFLMGPSYNIDQKALGGYIGYVKIIHNLHLQASLTTNNVREFKMSAKEGYLLILEAYWRW